MNDDPVERYLDELFEGLRNAPARDARSLMAETESHLRDSARDLQEQGMTELDSEIEAVKRFGDARHLAQADAERARPRIVTQVVATAWMLGAIGSLAVGVSGFVASLFRSAGMSSLVLAGQPPAAEMTRANCSRWLSIYPHAASCATAASADWAAEAVAPRIALGVLGLLAIGAVLLARRRRPQLRRALLPPLVVDTIATLAFAASGVWLAGKGIDAVAMAAGHGAGQWLSAAPVALAGATWFGLRLVKDLRPLPPPAVAV